MSLALLFSGQGLQHPEMLPWLDTQPQAAGLLAQMSRAIGSDWRQRLADPAWAERNDIAQSLITGTGLAAWQVLRSRGLPDPAVCAGYSVGEVAAFCAAGVFDAPAALELAGARAAAMDRCAQGHDGRLLAVGGAAAALGIGELESGVELAIRIGPDRCILGGDEAALHRAARTLATRGADLNWLRIRVASHTSAMRPAAQALAGRLEDMPWGVPRCPLVVNLDGAMRRDVPGLKHGLAAQVAHTVQWQQCLQTVAERRPRCVLEIGPGDALSRHWRATLSPVPSRSTDDFHDAESVVGWVQTCLRA